MLPQLPIWLISAGLFAGMLAAALFGRRLRMRDRRLEAAGAIEAAAEGQESYIVAAVTGLLALLLGFTFALAIDRFEARRILVVDEANAVERTYLRSQLLDEPYRGRLSGLLRAYVDNRLALGSARPGDTGVAERLAEDDRLITEIWSAAMAAFPSIRDYDFSSTFVDGVNELVELNAARAAARFARVPTIVLVLLVVYEVATAGVLGYALIGRRGRIAGAVLVVLFGLSLLLIIDIDRPTIGSVRESQQPMIWLRNRLDAWSTEDFGAPAGGFAPD